MNPEQPDVTAAVAALGREVERLRRLLEQQGTATEQAQETANTAHRELVGISEKLTLLARPRTPAVAEEDDAPAVVSWLSVTDPRHAWEEMSGLIEWLTTVYVHYPSGMDSLGECWLYHPAVVEELTALRYAWIDAYTRDGGNPARAVDWHDRQRPGVARRIEEVLAGCSLIRHQPGKAADKLAPKVPAVELADAVSSWWSTTHGTTSAPPPTPTALADAQARR